MSHRCLPGCDCQDGMNGSTPRVTTPNGSSVAVQPASGDGSTLCWGVAGGEALALAAGASVAITVSVQQYSWLKARYGTLTVRDPADPTATGLERWIRVLQVQAVGRQVVGSNAGISGNSIAADAENALAFGGSIPPINSSNTINVTIRNDHPAAALDVSFDVEGRAQQ